MKNPLNTFVIVQNEEVISPILTTTREYGRWLEELYGHSIAEIELYLRCKTKDGSSVLESHPGTKIGKWFDKRVFEKAEYLSWFVDQESVVFDRLKKLDVIRLLDCVDVNNSRMARLYTLNQLELYIKTNIDKRFSFFDDTLYLSPKQIKIRAGELKKILKPIIKATKKQLF